MAAILAVIVLGGCSGSGVTASAPGPAAAPARSAAAATAAAASPAAAAGGMPAGCPTGQASANLAAVEDLAAAFTSAGIQNAERWAEEVEEYRPYPDDPTWAKLAKELGKYNIDPVVFDAIVSCLKP